MLHRDGGYTHERATPPNRRDTRHRTRRPAPTPEPPPEPVAEAERPEGSWEGAGRYLTPELNALADRELAARREAEPTITAAMRSIEADLDGADLAGLETP
ncbi:MAG: hypothetical protein ACJ73S_11945 [Mycobacteriales bacterium]